MGRLKYHRHSPDLINREEYPHLKYVTKIWITQDEKYEILYDEIKGMKHLRIRRLDNKPIFNWMDLQEIKNDLLGEETVAINVHPKQSDFMDGSNTYHIWTVGAFIPNLKELYEYKES